LVGIGDGSVQTGLGQSDGPAADAEYGHDPGRVMATTKAFSPLAQEIFLGGPHLVEMDLGNGGGFVTKFGCFPGRPAG